MEAPSCGGDIESRDMSTQTLLHWISSHQDKAEKSSTKSSISYFSNDDE
jgi:hypothetical protein